MPSRVSWHSNSHNLVFAQNVGPHNSRGCIDNERGLRTRVRRPLLISYRTMTYRAGDGTRTHDVQLGKLAFYQLNYARTTWKIPARI